MVVPVGFDEQFAAARDDRLRVLVVGAGVAGVSAARLLRAQGLHPVLVERSSSTSSTEGYMLGLMPLADEPLRRLGAWSEYRKHSVAMHRYQLRSSRGRPVRTYSLDAVAEHGRYGGIERGQLMQAVEGPGVSATLGTTVTSLDQAAEGATAMLRVGSEEISARFDLVVVADGMHSATRDLVLGPDEVQTFDTGWGGWVAWSESDATEADLYAETWGRGFFVGRYPVRGRTGVFVGGPRQAIAAGVGPFLSHVRALLHQIDPMTARALAAVGEANDLYQWNFTDTWSSRWALDRVLLLGDAAAGFLPTAGIGAAMALESASVLAAHLVEVPAADIPWALREYEQQQRPRVIAAHENSRQLARLMFQDGRIGCTLRDIAMRGATVKMALGPIIKLHKTAPPIPM